MHEFSLDGGGDEEYSRLECDERVHGLAGELVVRADDGSLGNTVVQDEGRFDFGSGETMARDVDDIYGFNG